MSPTRIPPVLRRALVAAAVFTAVSWALIVAAVVAWAPGRSFASGLVSRVAQVATVDASAAPLAAAAVSGLVAPCVSSASLSVSDDSGDQGFAWCLVSGDGDVWIDGGDGRHRHLDGRTDEPRFWFRDADGEFEVHDPGVVAEVREAAKPLLDVGRQMGQVGGEIGRQASGIGRLAGRMGELSARMALLDAGLAGREDDGERRADTEAELRDLRARIAALRAEMAQQRAERGVERSALRARMSELRERHRELRREVRERVREIARRARREGKAERPHANA